MPKYKMRFMFDWGSGVCLWSDNDQTVTDFGDYPIEDLEKLPISAELAQELYYLIDKHDEALNWDDPAGDLLWSEQQITDFKRRATDAYERLVGELGKDYEVEFKDAWLI